jgi:exodeoxyribonuclease VII large subunit
MPNDWTPPEKRVYTVSQLNLEVRQVLESGFPLIWLEGEISNLSRPASGHLYFSLKDDTAQVRCALFRNRGRYVNQPLGNGLQVRVRARISLYEPRGEFQLIIEHLEDAGEGALRRAFEALKQKLDAEGLFATERKRALPRFPHRIGLITSPGGAAIRDVLSVLARRFPALPVLLYPTPVQGAEAVAGIVRALELAGARRDCDLLLLVRGGGSLEDLQSFNEEAVARAIAACPIPVVSGIGHETDVTIADFAADLRAPTPSAAAELVSPDRAEWQARFERLETALIAGLRRRLSGLNQRLDWQRQRLARVHPSRRLQDRAQRLDELDQRLRRALHQRLERERSRLANLDVRLRSHSPRRRLAALAEHHAALNRRLHTALHQELNTRRQRLAELGRALHAVSPLATLSRGYAIVRRPDSGAIVRRADQVTTGESLEVLLAEGRLQVRVDR